EPFEEVGSVVEQVAVASLIIPRRLIEELRTDPSIQGDYPVRTFMHRVQLPQLFRVQVNCQGGHRCPQSQAGGNCALMRAVCFDDVSFEPPCDSRLQGRRHVPGAVSIEGMFGPQRGEQVPESCGAWSGLCCEVGHVSLSQVLHHCKVVSLMVAGDPG